MTASDRLEREKNFHDNRFGGDDSDRKSVENTTWPIFIWKKDILI